MLLTSRHNQTKYGVFVFHIPVFEVVVLSVYLVKTSSFQASGKNGYFFVAISIYFFYIFRSSIDIFFYVCIDFTNERK